MQPGDSKFWSGLNATKNRARPNMQEDIPTHILVVIQSLISIRKVPSSSPGGLEPCNRDGTT